MTIAFKTLQNVVQMSLALLLVILSGLRCFHLLAEWLHCLVEVVVPNAASWQMMVAMLS